MVGVNHGHRPQERRRPLPPDFLRSRSNSLHRSRYDCSLSVKCSAACNMSGRTARHIRSDHNFGGFDLASFLKIASTVCPGALLRCRFTMEMASFWCAQIITTGSKLVKSNVGNINPLSLMRLRLTGADTRRSLGNQKGMRRKG
jgi:hypothetical protein